MFDYSLEPGKELNKRNHVDGKPLISIITPFYSGKDFIEQTANSVLNQTFPFFEWIIVDDGSPYKDKKKLLNKIESMDTRIKVFYKQNEGLAATRDYGASVATPSTKYFFFLDDDDLIEKTYLEIAYYTMELHPDASWCYSDSINFGLKRLQWRKHYNPEQMLNENLLVATALIRKEDFNLVNGYELKEKNINEDWNFWLKLIAKEKYPIHLGYNGFWYRIKQNGELARANDNKKRTMTILEDTKKNIVKFPKAIEYPVEFNRWEKVEENIIHLPAIKKDSKKQILMIIPWMVIGGADQYNVDLLRLVDKNRFNFTIVTTQPTEYVWRQKFEQYADSVFELSSFLEPKYWAAFLEYLVKSRNIDLIFISNSLTGYELSPYLKAKFPKIPIMDYIHMEEWYNRNGGYSRDSSAFADIIDRTLLCNKNSERILVDYFKRDSSKLNTVYIGVDEKKYNPENYNRKELLKKYKIPKGKIVVNFVARIDYQKRPFLLMKIIKASVKKHNNLLFIVAGNGPLLEQCKKIAKKDKICHYVRFIGKTNTPGEIYTISDITLNCSIKEGVALTSYESMALGVPVISSDVGGQKELITPDVGIIVPCLQAEKDVMDFDYSRKEISLYVDAIDKMIIHLKEYKSLCRNRILKYFTIDKMAKNMEKEFTNVINNNANNSNNRSIDIIKEYIGQYFMANYYDYKYLCDLYREKVFNYADIDKNYIPESSYLSIKRKIYNLIMKISIKLHIYNEILIIINFILSLFFYIKNIIILIFSSISNLLTLEFRRIINLFKKVLIFFRIIKE
jgi:glycosyltransferase involved in cell wall biosynthesis